MTRLNSAAAAVADKRGPRYDDEGFLIDPDDWSPRLAEALAKQEGLGELTARHWAVIDYVRDRYFRLGALPVMRLVCRAAGIRPSAGHDLFPGCRSLWRIAGLPNPGPEAITYMH